MGYKSKDSYKPGLCMRFDCINRDVLCDTECYSFNKYKRRVENDSTPKEG